MKKQMRFMVLAGVAAFGGVFAVELPKDYVKLDYIRSNGGGYIDTGYVHQPNTKVEADMEIAEGGQFREWVAAFGARETNFHHHCYCFFTHSELPGAAYARTGRESVGDKFIYGARVALTCERDLATWHVVGDPSRRGQIRTTGTIDGGTTSFFIFNLNTALAGGKLPDKSPAVMTLYGFSLSEGETLKRDFQPCRSPKGEAGLWDRVEGRFYGNAGTGRFTGSDGVYSPAPSTLMTPWGEKITPANAWREYPRPQLVRDGWTNLNGEWDWAITSLASTAGRPTAWTGKILVPFAFESALSGVGRIVTPSELLWYTRKIVCTKKPGERLLLHFGGADFRTMVFIGHTEVTDVPHEGGILPWSVDITDYVTDGENELTLCLWDPTEDFVNANGKQRFKTGGCVYTRVSGIWQTVWMESVPTRHIRDYKVVTDIDASTVTFAFDVAEAACDTPVEVEIDGVGKLTGPANAIKASIPNAQLWSPEHPHLYTFTARCGADTMKGYFGMRKFAKARDKNGVWRFFLNNKPTFIIGTLDQGWWPDGLLTPPSDDAMAFDITALKNYGFNMMRKHMKIEPMRYYSLCDKLGILVVQDLPPGGGNPRSAAGVLQATKRYGLSRSDMKEMMDKLQKVPSIVMWCPYNEGGDQANEFLTHSMLDFTRRYDPTRLVNGPSGWFDYEGGAFAHQQPARTKHKPEGVCEAADTIDMHLYRGPGMPAVNARRICFLGEFGGLGHVVPGHTWRAIAGNWGYGGTRDTATRDGLTKVYLGLITHLEALARQGLSGSVYTQTTDVEVEVNGLITYDRRVLKLDTPTVKAAHERVVQAVK